MISPHFEFNFSSRFETASSKICRTRARFDSSGRLTPLRGSSLPLSDSIKRFINFEPYSIASWGDSSFYRISKTFWENFTFLVFRNHAFIRVNLVLVLTVYFFDAINTIRSHASRWFRATITGQWWSRMHCRRVSAKAITRAKTVSISSIIIKTVKRVFDTENENLAKNGPEKTSKDNPNLVIVYAVIACDCRSHRRSSRSRSFASRNRARASGLATPGAHDSA